MFGIVSSEKSAVWYPVLFNTTQNIIRAVCIWITLALIVGYIVTFCLLKDSDSWKKINKIYLWGCFYFFLVIALIQLIFSFVEDGIVAILFYPLLILLLSIILCGILICFKPEKLTYILVASLVGSCVIAVLVCMTIYFASGKAAEMNWLVNEDVNTIWLYVFSLLALAALVFTALFVGRDDKAPLNTRSIAYGAVCISLSFALSYVSILKMPQGGTITIASLLPLMIYSVIFGIKKGVFTGMIYGLLQAFQDPYILHPAQFLLDYPVAFACIGLAGLFTTLGVLKDYPRVQFLLGAIVAGSARFLMHFLSGIFAFGAFAPEGVHVAIYSLSYQTAYILPDLAICIFVGVLLFSSKSFVTVLRRARLQK